MWVYFFFVIFFSRHSGVTSWTHTHQSPQDSRVHNILTCARTRFIHSNAAAATYSPWSSPRIANTAAASSTRYYYTDVCHTHTRACGALCGGPVHRRRRRRPLPPSLETIIIIYLILLLLFQKRRAYTPNMCLYSVVPAKYNLTVAAFCPESKGFRFFPPDYIIILNHYYLLSCRHMSATVGGSAHFNEYFLIHSFILYIII